MCAENLLKKAYTDYEFVLGKKTGNEEMKFVRGFETIEELEEDYRTWLLQSDEDSEEHLPYEHFEGILYRPMWEIVIKIEDELTKKTQDQGNQYIM